MKTYKEAKLKTDEQQKVVFDVVCGMEIITDKTRASSTFHETTYYFCSHHCKQHFDNAPERYVWEG
jgi:YHS domain-containing protein